MAGSGGYFSGSYKPEELAKKTRDAEDKTDGAEFKTKVEKYLAEQLAEFNNRDVDGTKKVLDQVSKDLDASAEIEGAVDLLFGGSVQKHTYVDGLSDVDALVLFHRDDIAKKTPDDLKSLLGDMLSSRYGKHSVYVGNLAVTLSHEGKVIQLVPAVREGDQFKIATSSGKNWSTINPSKFAAALTKANKGMDNKLVPCIKLAKAMIGTLPDQRQITGYHAESLAIKIFRDYKGEKTPRSILHHFFEQAATHVRQPIKDSSGQSVHVDGYMGDADSLRRRIVADSFGRIARRMKNADGARSMQQWQELFD